MSDLHDSISKIGWTTTLTEGPEGEWSQLSSKFAKQGYARLLAQVDEDRVALEFAHPAIDASTLAAQLPGNWHILNQTTIAKSGSEGWFDELVQLDKVVNLFGSEDDVHAGLEALFGAPKSATETTSHEVADEPSFEEIGSATEPAPLFGYDIAESTGHLHVGLGLGNTVEAGPFGRFETTISRNLRAKFDVTASVITRTDSKVTLKQNFKHELHIAVTTAEPIAQIRNQVAEYLDKILDLANSGIDPLVFLGVSAATFAERPPTPSLVAEPDQTADAFILFSPQDSDAPLVAGDFEDARLRERDTSASIVDVVLRHPGYSERNMGQVLSLLMSIEYHDAQEVIGSAPTIIGWSVPRERALTMKTVIEGAGGKVHLAEPGTFGVE